MEATDQNINVAIDKVLLKTHAKTGITALKAEQCAALKAFLCGRDVLGVLPTGFGKSFIYQLEADARFIQDTTVWYRRGRGPCCL